MASLETADPWWVYLVRCADGTLYCGVARDVEARVAQHGTPRGARYTRGRAPVSLAWREAHPTRGAAARDRGQAPPARGEAAARRAQARLKTS